MPIAKTTYLIAGDSRSQRSVDPSILGSGRNISQTAEPYYITYHKLQKIYNSWTPDTLILSFSTAGISEFNDYKLSDPQWNHEMARRYYPFMQLLDYSKKIDVDYKTIAQVWFKQTAYMPRSHHFNYMVEYENSPRQDVSNWEESAHRHFYRDGRQLGHSQISIDYLDSIIRMHQRQGVPVVLVNPPVYAKYRAMTPTPLLQKYQELVQKYENKVLIFDQSQIDYPDSMFIDADHLNQPGAERFTTELKQFLNQAAHKP